MFHIANSGPLESALHACGVAINAVCAFTSQSLKLGKKRPFCVCLSLFPFGAKVHNNPKLADLFINTTTVFGATCAHMYTKQTTHNACTPVHIATYGVQDVEISEVSLLNSICITCIFAQGTSAQGCYISLLENHDSVVTNATGLRIEREGDSLNVAGCVENLEGGLYHVVVYDVEADGTVDWHNRVFFLTAALNWTSPSLEPDQLNTGEPSLCDT